MNQVWEDLLGFPAMRMVDGRYPLPTKAGPWASTSARRL